MQRILMILFALGIVLLATGFIVSRGYPQEGRRTAMKGAVVEVKPESRSLTLLTSARSDVHFRTNDATVVERYDSRIRLRDLRPAEVVMVVYTTEKDEKTARLITVETH